MDVALNWFIHLKSPTSGFIGNHPTLGMHTDVYLFEKKGVQRRFTWSHPGLRPWGMVAPVQCPKCLSPKPWIKPTVDLKLETITLTCGYEGCRRALPTFVKPGNLLRYTHGEPSKTDGEWYYEFM
jgi:hypothetical protein